MTIRVRAGKQDIGVVVLGKVTVFQKTNLLEQSEFDQLQTYKKSLIKDKKPAVVLNSDGTTTILDKLEPVNSGTGLNTDYEVSPGTFFNYRYNIEDYIPYIGEGYSNIMYKTQGVFKEKGLVNPRPYMVRAYTHNKPSVEWHKHIRPKNIAPSKFWISIFYMHPEWDVSYGGIMDIGLTDKEPIETYDTLSNSLIAHNGYYGHGVKKITMGYEGDRDIFLAHWVTD